VQTSGLICHADLFLAGESDPDEEPTEERVSAAGDSASGSSPTGSYVQPDVLQWPRAVVASDMDVDPSFMALALSTSVPLYPAAVVEAPPIPSAQLGTVDEADATYPLAPYEVQQPAPQQLPPTTIDPTLLPQDVGIVAPVSGPSLDPIIAWCGRSPIRDSSVMTHELAVGPAEPVLL
jgi:hypothetical protein